MVPKAFNRILWITSGLSLILLALSSFGLWYMHKGGEPYFPLYNFLWQNEILLQWVVTFAGFIGQGSLITLLVLAIVKRLKAAPAFTKERKFTLMLRYALLIAGIPGLAFTPFFLAMLMRPTNTLEPITSALAFLSAGSIFPGMITMITLFVFALLTLTKKTIDPESPTPKPKRNQILLAIPTAAMPVIAFVNIWLGSQNCDTQQCGTIFDSPITQAAGVLYVLLWIPITTIWINSKRPKTTA